MPIGVMVEAWGQGKVESSRWCGVDCRGLKTLERNQTTEAREWLLQSVADGRCQRVTDLLRGSAT